MGREPPSPRRGNTQHRSRRSKSITRRSPLESWVQGTATRSTMARLAVAPLQIPDRAPPPPPPSQTPPPPPGNVIIDPSPRAYLNDDVERFHSVETRMDLLNDQISTNLRLNDSELTKRSNEVMYKDECQSEDLGEGADEWEDEMVESDKEGESSHDAIGRATVPAENTNISKRMSGIDEEKDDSDSGSSHGVTEKAIEAAKHNILDKRLSSPDALSASTASTQYSSPEKRQAGILAKKTRNENFIKLLQTNKVFQDLMSTLNGLREWWHSNHREWKQKREELHEIISSIANLESQIKFYMDIYESQTQEFKEPFRIKAEELRSQVELAEAEREQKMDWFFGREKLMRRVQSHFKDMKAEYTLYYANSKREPKTVVEIAERIDFMYDDSDAAKKDISQTAWKRNKRTFKWWLRCAAEDLELSTVILEQKVQEYETGVANCDNRIQSLEDKSRDDETEMHGTESHLSQELLAIEQQMQQQASGPRDNSVDIQALQYQEEVNKQLYQEMLDRKCQAQRQREQRAAEKLENEGRRTALLEEREIHAFALLSYQEQWRRSVAVLSAIKVWLKAQPHVNPNTKELNTQFHSLVCLHRKRQVQGREYLHLMIDKSASLNNTDRIYILKKSAQHLTDWEEAEIVFGLRLAENLFRDGWLKSLLDMYDKEEKEFTEVLNSANRRQKDAKSRATNEAMDLGLRGLTFASTKSASTVSQGSSVWKVNSSMAADPILNSKISYEAVDGLLREDTVFHFLKSLFGQPDISPKIMDIAYYKDRHQLLRHLNRFIKYQVTIVQIEAFLWWCHDGEMFFELAQIGSKVRTLPWGWELYDESFYDRKGPARTPLLLKPPLADELTVLLRNNQEILKLNGRERNITENKLIERINQLRVELPKNTDRKGFHDAFLFFSMGGRMFRFLPPTNETRDNLIMHRIENGWKHQGNPASTRWLPNFSEPPAYYHRIRDLIVSKDIQQLLIQEKPGNKDSLHATLAKYFQDNRKSFVARGGVKVTEWRFFLFLRYCDQLGELLRIYRNGDLEYIESGWAEVYTFPEWRWRQ